MTHYRLEVAYRSVSDLRANPRNARTHSKKQIAQLKGSILSFGFTSPPLIDEHGIVIAGHARLAAAKELGFDEVPTITVTGLTEKQKRALMLADNKIAANAGWDLDLLREELIELLDPDVEFDIDLGAMGFETPEVDFIIGERDEKETSDDPVDQVDAIDRSVPSVSQLGDLWDLGPHKILVGNALEEGSYTALMAGEIAAQVVTDPPFNVPIAGFVSGLGGKRHAEFAMASGEMSPAQFTTFLTTALQRMASVSKDGAILHCFMDWRHLREILAAGEAAGLSLINLCVWAKSNGGMGSLYRSKHELIPVFKKGMASHTNNVELGRHGRYRTNVWEYAGANSFRRGRKKDLAAHPTVKPVAMIMDAIKDCSHLNEIILDPFGGSGTTLLAAERTGRRARLMELDPYYVDATIRRWEAMTGRKARHAVTGAAFISSSVEDAA